MRRRRSGPGDARGCCGGGCPAGYAARTAAAAFRPGIGRPELPPRRLLELLREVEDEEPLLGVEFSEELQRVNVQVMGEVQLEVLQAVLRERYGRRGIVRPCGVLYRETIANAVVGCLAISSRCAIMPRYTCAFRRARREAA